MSASLYEHIKAIFALAVCISGGTSAIVVACIVVGSAFFNFIQRRRY